MKIENSEKNNLLKIENREKNILKKNLEENRENFVKLERNFEIEKNNFPKNSENEKKSKIYLEKAKKLKEQNSRFKAKIHEIEAEKDMLSLKYKLERCELVDRNEELSLMNSRLEQQIRDLLEQKSIEFDYRFSVIEKDFRNKMMAQERQYRYDITLARRSEASLKMLLKAAEESNNELIAKINDKN